MADLKALAQRMYDEAINGGNLDLLDEVMADDFVEHEALPGMPADREGPKQLFHMVRAAFPDFRMRVEDMIAEGDKVVARLRLLGTHKGDFMGVPASGEVIDISAIDILQFRGDHIIAHWGVTDMAAMMEQMGASAPPG
jgi:steroid delta-isomerase-like uncharacterized protein